MITENFHVEILLNSDEIDYLSVLKSSAQIYSLMKSRQHSKPVEVGCLKLKNTVESSLSSSSLKRPNVSQPQPPKSKTQPVSLLKVEPDPGYQWQVLRCLVGFQNGSNSAPNISKAPKSNVTARFNGKCDLWPRYEWQCGLPLPELLQIFRESTTGQKTFQHNA